MPLPAEQEFDVAIIGGALSGASAAICLLREEPGLRVLIVERSGAFTRRVGEATVEVSGFFLTRVLGLTRHLNQEHLVKQGLRFWFARDRDTGFADCSEIGGRYLARVPAFQVDRAVLDEHVLERAVELGAELWRPARVASVEPLGNGRSALAIHRGDDRGRVTARWVVDASGVRSMLARRRGWRRPNERHPTAAVWARWSGVRDWDGPELAARHPEWARECYGMRGPATNHLMGDGWWGWMIPLRSGDTSIGVVYDERLFCWPTGGSTAEQLRSVIRSHPVGREILADARWVEGDVHVRRNLAYRSEVFAEDGLVLVGDAAGFLDPFYSPGLDWVSFTVTAASRLIAAARRGEPVAPLVEKHNRSFARAYDRWFEALFRDKYEVMGDFELMRVAFVLDLGLYYLGVARQPYRRGAAALAEAIFTAPESTPFYHLIRTYNRRLATMARCRRRRGVLGRRNAGRRCLLDGYTFSGRSAIGILRGMLGWLRLELTEGWRTWLRAPGPAPRASAPSRARPSPPADAPPLAGRTGVPSRKSG